MDFPATLPVLELLLGHRGDRVELGYERTGHGAWVDWDRLLDGPLSSSEKTAILAALCVARCEQFGGVPSGVVPLLRVSFGRVLC